VADCATAPDGKGLGSRIDTSVPSVILFRPEGERGASGQAGLLLSNCDQGAADLDAGSIVVMEATRVRVRRLPAGSAE